MSAKKYFWLKLKDDFFGQKEIKLLRKIAGGDTYTIIYLKMLLMSLKNNGLIYYDGVATNFIEEIALEIDEDIENVGVTFNFLQSKGLIEFIKDDEIELTNIASMVGSETDKASMMRRLRKQRKEEKILGNSNDVTQQLPDSYTEIEIEIEKEIELDKDKEIEKNVTPDKPAKPSKHKYGEYKRVLLTDEELEKVKTEFPNDWQQRIDRLDEYIESTGKKYKSHLATIRSWARRDKDKPKNFGYSKPQKQEQVPYWANQQASEQPKQVNAGNEEELRNRLSNLFGKGGDDNG